MDSNIIHNNNHNKPYTIQEEQEMKITINSLTEEGKKGLTKYFKQDLRTKVFNKLNQINITQQNNESGIVIITITKKFANENKDKTYVVYLINDLLKEHLIEILKDYQIEVKFDE